MHRTPLKVVIPNLSKLPKYANLCKLVLKKFANLWNKFFRTYFFSLTYLYMLWAWPKGACWMQTDRSTDKQTDFLCLLRQRNWRTTHWNCMACWPRSFGVLPRSLYVIAIYGRGLKTDFVQTDRRILGATPIVIGENLTNLLRCWDL